MILPFSAIAESEYETEQIAKKFYSIVKNGNIIALNGNLGSGKTFFVKKFCEEIGVFEVNSPTFSLVNEYYGKYKVYHLDFYRINNLNELYDIGINDYLSDSDAVKFIEWADMMPEILPNEYFEVRIDYINETVRKIEIMKHGK